MAMSQMMITALVQLKPLLSVPNEHGTAISHDAVSLREMEDHALTGANQQSWLNTWTTG